MIFSLSNNRLKKKISTLFSCNHWVSRLWFQLISFYHTSHISHIFLHMFYIYIYLLHCIFHTLHCYGPWPRVKSSTLNLTIIPLLSRTHLHLLPALMSDHDIICKHHSSCRFLSNVTNAEHMLYVLEIKSDLPDRDGVGMYKGEMENMLVQGC